MQAVSKPPSAPVPPELLPLLLPELLPELLPLLDPLPLPDPLLHGVAQLVLMQSPKVWSALEQLDSSIFDVQLAAADELYVPPGQEHDR